MGQADGRCPERGQLEGDALRDDGVDGDRVGDTRRSKRRDALEHARGIGAAQKHLRHLQLATTEGSYIDRSKDEADDNTDVLEHLSARTD
jgi:hypothetical protein